MDWSICPERTSAARASPSRSRARRLLRFLFDRDQVNSAYLRAESNWPAYGIHVVLSSALVALLHIDAVSAFFGVTPGLALELVLGNVIPYTVVFIWRRWTKRYTDHVVAFVCFMVHLNLFLIGAFIVAAAKPLTPFWAFYFLYVGAVANALGFQPYMLLLVVLAGLAPGWLGGWDASPRWVVAGLFAFLGSWQYVFLGLMVRRTLALERHTGTLEHDRRIAAERARIVEETNCGLGQALSAARASSEALAAMVPEGSAADLSTQLLETQEQLRRAMSQLRQALWSLDSTPATVADLLSHMKRCFGDLCQAAGVDLTTSLPLPASGERTFALSPLLKHHIYCMASEAVSAALRRPGLSRIAAAARHDGRQLELSIEADGEPTLDDAALTSGLATRAAKVAGTVGMHRPSGGGTMVSLRVPLADTTPGTVRPGGCSL